MIELSTESEGVFYECALRDTLARREETNAARGFLASGSARRGRVLHNEVYSSLHIDLLILSCHKHILLLMSKF